MKEVVTKEALAGIGAPDLVYVRTVLGRDVFPDGETGDGVAVPPDAILYCVHAADGTRLAVTDDRDAAYEAARGYDLEPVSVH